MLRLVLASLTMITFTLGGCAVDEPQSSRLAAAVDEEDEAELGCAPLQDALRSPSGVEVGTVTVEHGDDALLVTVEAEGISSEWFFGEVALYLGAVPAPSLADGSLDIGAFPYRRHFDGLERTTTFVVPYAELGLGCGELVKVAVWATIAPEEAPIDSRELLQFGVGQLSAAFERCCEPAGCTLTQGYWKNHEAAWPVTELTLGDRDYSQEELLELLWTPPAGGDASLILGHQLIAAELNLAAGAALSPAIEEAFDDAHLWLIAHADSDGALPFGTRPHFDGRAAAIDLAGALGDFNEGSTATPHCDDDDWDDHDDDDEGRGDHDH